MIAPLQQVRHAHAAPAWHAGFLDMLPRIVRHARVRLRHLKPEAKQEALQDIAANATAAYARLAELGKPELAYPTVLANYAVAQYWDGRRVGNQLNIRDVLSEYAQRHRHFTVERLDTFDEEQDAWREAVVADTRGTPVPDLVSFRIDFPAWLATHSRRNRRIAAALAAGYSTGEVACRPSRRASKRDRPQTLARHLCGRGWREWSFV